MSLKPKKSLGQNFLNDPNIIRKIVRHLKADSNDQIIEIGPGTGALTGELLKEYHNLTVIEIDDQAVKLLKQKFPGLHIIHSDILKINWNDLIDRSNPVYVIGNLPYYITTPILFSVLDNNKLFSRALLMMQKEVARRLSAVPGTREYGILSVQVQLMSSVQYEFTVSRNVFYPVPNVDSAIVSLDFNKPPLKCQLANLKKVVRTAFNQRRKKLSNALKSIVPKDTQLPFDLSRRAEELPPGEYDDLTILLEESGYLTK